MRLLACTTLCLCSLATPALAAEPSRTDGAEEKLPETAEGSSGVDAASAREFADALLTEKDDPFNALTWYRLSEHLGDDSGNTQFRIALCYERGERYEAAEQAWLNVAEADTSLSPRATYRAGVSALEAGEPSLALLHLSEVRLEDGASPWASRSMVAEAIVRLKQGELELADRQLADFLAAHPSGELAPQAQTARELLEAKVPRRSPALAGVMSTVLPGSGQVYAGHSGDGLMAFLASAVLGGWSASLIYYGLEDERTWALAAGGTLGAVALFNWSSNVVGAVRGARRTNTHLRRRRAEDVLEATAHPSLELDARDVELPAD